MSTALVNRMPFRRGTGKIDNISYILDNRWSGSPKITANDGEEDSRDNFRLPRQFPFDDGILKRSASASKKPRSKSIDGIIRGEVTQVLSNLLRTLLTQGTTLDAVIVSDEKRIIESIESPKNPDQGSKPISPSLFSYFTNPLYKVGTLGFTEFNSGYLFRQPIFAYAPLLPSRTLGHIDVNYVHPLLKKQVRTRLRKRKYMYNANMKSRAPSTNYLTSNTSNHSKQPYSAHKSGTLLDAMPYKISSTYKATKIDGTFPNYLNGSQHHPNRPTVYLPIDNSPIVKKMQTYVHVGSPQHYPSADLSPIQPINTPTTKSTLPSTYPTQSHQSQQPFRYDRSMDMSLHKTLHSPIALPAPSLPMFHFANNHHVHTPRPMDQDHDKLLQQSKPLSAYSTPIAEKNNVTANNSSMSISPRHSMPSIITSVISVTSAYSSNHSIAPSHESSMVYSNVERGSEHYQKPIQTQTIDSLVQSVPLGVPLVDIDGSAVQGAYVVLDRIITPTDIKNAKMHLGIEALIDVITLVAYLGNTAKLPVRLVNQTYPNTVTGLQSEGRILLDTKDEKLWHYHIEVNGSLPSYTHTGDTPLSTPASSGMAIKLVRHLPDIAVKYWGDMHGSSASQNASAPLAQPSKNYHRKSA